MNQLREPLTEYTEYVDFRQYLLAIKRRWVPGAIIYGSVIALTAVYTLLQKPVYEAKGKLLIMQPSNISSAISQEKLQPERLSPIGRESDPLATEAELIRSISIASKVIARFQLELQPQEFLQKKLHVQPVDDTDILAVSYTNANPKQAAAVVNAVLTLYLENSTINNHIDVKAAREFIESQLPKIEAELAQAEADLRQFKTENKVTNLSEVTNQNIAAIKTLENKIDETSAELEDINSRFEQLGKHLDLSLEEAITINALSQTPISKILTELQNVKIQLANQRERFSEEAPQIVSLKEREVELKNILRSQIKQTRKNEQIGSLENLNILNLGSEDNNEQSLINEFANLGVQRSGVSNKLTELNRRLDAHNQRLQTLPSLEEKQRKLERRVKATQATYETLLKRLEEIQVEENRNVGNVRLAEKAEVPEKPIAPNLTTNLALGSILGILLATGTALFLDRLDTSIKSVKEAKQVFGSIVLGLIPLYPKIEKSTSHAQVSEQSVPKIVVRDTPYCPVSEAYRMLEVNLKFWSSDKEQKVFVITSSVPEEGKSTVSENLAVAMAQSGRRVLLIDGNMRQPVQHQIWNLPNQIGLSNVLEGQVEIKSVLQEVMPNLHVLPAGVIPLNPAALLDSQPMASLIKQFRDDYDSVIIDTPSLSITADALILGKMADGILLVVRPGVVDSASANTAKEFLEQSGQKVLGQVVTGVTSENKFSSYQKMLHPARQYF